MIWKWINAIVAFLRMFFMPPEFIIRKIDPNAPCPGCGATRGKITATQQADGRLLIQHDCSICHAKWWENPVLQSIAATSSTVKLAAEAPKE